MIGAALAALSLLAAAASATASVRTTRVEAGEPVSVTVRVAARPNALVSIRPPASRPPSFTVEPGGQRLVQSDAEGIAVFTWELVPWEHGSITVPPTAIEVGGVRGLESNALALESFNPVGPDAAKAAPKDIRGIREFPTRPSFLLMFIAGAVLAAIGWFLLKPKAADPPAPVSVARPRAPIPREDTLADAIERVRRIVEDPPHDARGIRDAHFVIAEAVRRFVEERWEVPATKQTTEEFLRAIARRGTFQGGGMSLLPVVLESCDRVKWAGDGAGRQDTLELARLALDFFAASRGSVRGLGGGERSPSFERGAAHRPQERP